MAINQPKKTLVKHLTQLSILVCSLFSMNLQAACDGDDGDDYYGNGQLCAFKNAIEGTEVLSPQDQAYMGSVEQNRIVNRAYLRAMVGQPKVKVTNWEMSATNPSPFTGASLNNPDTTANLTQLLLAFGYLWEQWALEGEFLFSKKLNFTQTFTGTPVYVTGDIKQFAFFVNLQYIIPRFFSWYPQRLQIHLDAGVGPSLKRTEVSSYNADGSPRQSDSEQRIAPAGTLGVGARYQVTTSILVDIAYRFFEMGETKYSIDGGEFKASKMRSTGFFIGAMYEF